MPVDFQVESLGDHEYLVTFPAGGECVRSRFRATEETLGKLARAEADEERIVTETAAYLVDHQQVIDIPPMIDLDDVEAAYGADYLESVTRRLSAA